MCISTAVGKGCGHSRVDIKIIQTALNLVENEKFSLSEKLKITGKATAPTIAAIESFQSKVAGFNKPDGVISPNGKTLGILHKEMHKDLNINSFIAIMAPGDSDYVTPFFSWFKTLFPKYHISTPLRIAHFLAQIGHESMSLRYMEEIASGQAYEGRENLGNTEKGDGKRFKGRGFIQLTGRSNYAAYSKYTNLNFLQSGNEILVARMPYALDVSLWFWEDNEINEIADRDDIGGVTYAVNGGFRGLRDREKYLQRAKFFLID
ncbi:MAG: chitinase [Gammaproteobacteria bacterium]|nr:chitinase [Gammaproteobacteria bacterium]